MSEFDDEQSESIEIHVSSHREKVPQYNQQRVPIRKSIKRNNAVLQALSLPVVINLNPRSMYNKVDDLKIIVEQYEADVVFISESWERHKLSLNDIIQIENYEIVSTVKKRDFRGGNPALIINSEKYNITEICPEPITVPIGVEAIWAIISPKHSGAQAKVKNIALCSFY